MKTDVGVRGFFPLKKATSGCNSKFRSSDQTGCQRRERTRMAMECSSAHCALANWPWRGEAQIPALRAERAARCVGMSSAPSASSSHYPRRERAPRMGAARCAVLPSPSSTPSFCRRARPSGTRPATGLRREAPLQRRIHTLRSRPQSPAARSTQTHLWTWTWTGETRWRVGCGGVYVVCALCAQAECVFLCKHACLCECGLWKSVCERACACVRVFVKCVCVCLCVCACTRACACMCACVCARACVRARVRVCGCVRGSALRTCVCVCVRVCWYFCAWVCEGVYYMSLCKCVCVCVRARARIHTCNAHAHIHRYR